MLILKAAKCDWLMMPEINGSYGSAVFSPIGFGLSLLHHFLGTVLPAVSAHLAFQREDVTSDSYTLTVLVHRWMGQYCHSDWDSQSPSSEAKEHLIFRASAHQSVPVLRTECSATALIMYSATMCVGFRGDTCTRPGGHCASTARVKCICRARAPASLQLAKAIITQSAAGCAQQARSLFNINNLLRAYTCLITLIDLGIQCVFSEVHSFCSGKPLHAHAADISS